MVDDYNQWYFADPLIEAVKSGAVPESIVDEKVANILRVPLNLIKITSFNYLSE